MDSSHSNSELPTTLASNAPPKAKQMFIIPIGMGMFFVCALDLVQSAIEFGKETLAGSGLPDGVQCAFGFLLCVICVLMWVIPLGFGMCLLEDEDPGTMARRGYKKYHIPGE